MQVPLPTPLPSTALAGVGCGTPDSSHVSAQGRAVLFSEQKRQTVSAPPLTWQLS